MIDNPIITTYTELERAWFSDSETIACNTSGSTGKPKIINIPKKLMIESAYRTNLFFGITSQSHLHSCISPEYIGGKMMFVRAVIADALFSFEEPSNQPLKYYDDSIIDLLSVVPSQMKYLLDNAEKQKMVKNYLIGGAPIPDVIKKGISLSGVKAWESYGMTETASHIALRGVTGMEKPFRVLPGIQISKSNNDTLIINMGNNNSIITNDICELISPEEFIIIGRLDNIINTGGIKIFPEKLEYKLSSLLKFPFYIASRPDSLWGSRIVLVGENPDISLDELKRLCKGLLKPAEIPKEIVPVSKLPLNPNGKIPTASRFL